MKNLLSILTPLLFITLFFGVAQSIDIPVESESSIVMCSSISAMDYQGTNQPVLEQVSQPGRTVPYVSQFTNIQSDVESLHEIQNGIEMRSNYYRKSSIDNNHSGELVLKTLHPYRSEPYNECYSDNSSSFEQHQRKGPILDIIKPIIRRLFS